MEHEPAAGAVTATRTIADIGVTVVTFANGVQAWLKPTDFKNDQVLFTHVRERRCVARRAARLPGRLALDRVREPVGRGRTQGAGSAEAAGRQTGVGVARSSSLSTHGFAGSAAPAELETALQLLYAKFTQPGDDPDAFALLKSQLVAAVANRGRSPGQVFGEKVEEVNTSNHYTSSR